MKNVSIFPHIFYLPKPSLKGLGGEGKGGKGERRESLPLV